jgi:hypothetical protein
MAKAEGMALTPFGALGGGKFKTEEERKSGEGKNLAFEEKVHPFNHDALNKVVAVLEKLGKSQRGLLRQVLHSAMSCRR